MNYCLTMEQTRRIAVWFDADSDDTPSKDFEAGDDERDCALSNRDTNTMVFDWS